MEIRVIPSKLETHKFYLDEEIHISRCIEEMAKIECEMLPDGKEILRRIGELNKSIERRREILNDFSEALKQLQAWTEEYVASLE